MYKKAVLISSANVTIDRAPAGLAFLAGICEHNQLDYEIFDSNLFLRKTYGEIVHQKIDVAGSFMEWNFYDDPELEQLINDAVNNAADLVVQHNPDLIAMTSLSNVQIAWTDKLLSAIRQKTNATIITGGPGISYEQIVGKTAGRILAEKNLIDYYVLGEGDNAFDNFLKGQIDLGVNHKDNAIDQWVPQIDNLDNVILPTYKKFDFSNYGAHTFGIKLPSTINITGSRGCVRRCTFCDIGHLWKKFRFRSSDSIVAEILKHHKETGCVNYFFNDSLINGSMKQFAEIMEKLTALKEVHEELIPIRYSGQFILRPKQHHPERIYKSMKLSGCDHIQIGVESGSEAVRDHMGKKFSNADMDYHFEMCSKYGIKNYIFMMVSYPTETYEDFQDTVNFYIKNQKYLIDQTIIGTNVSAPMGIYINTPIHTMSNELGIEMHDTEYFNASNWTISTNSTLTVKERYRRYIELSTITTQLRYPKATEELVFLELNIDDIKKEIKYQKKKTFTINKINEEN